MQVELFAIPFSKVISKSSKYRLYSLTIKVKTLTHSTREAALTKGVMLTQRPKVWSPIDLEKLGRCQEEALKSQTSDTEQDNLVFNSANFLLIRDSLTLELSQKGIAIRFLSSLNLSG